MNKPNAFDPADYLDSDEIIAEYLSLARSMGDMSLLALAVSDVLRARERAKPVAAPDQGGWTVA